MSDVIFEAGANQNLPDGTYLPYIESGYGVKYRADFIGGSWYSVPFPQSKIWYFYEKGVQTPVKWFDYSNLCNSLADKGNYRDWSDFVSTHSLIINGYNENDDIETAKNNFNNDVAWVWGSLDDGGMFIVKRAENPSQLDSLAYSFVLVYGLIEREPENTHYNDGKYYYHMQVSGGGNRYYLSQMRHVAWFIYDETRYPDNHEMVHNPVYLSVFCAGGNWEFGNCIGVTGIQTPEYVTSEPSWDVLATAPPIEQPIMAFFWSGWENSKTDWYGITIENAILISGSPLGNEEFGDEPSGSGGNTTGGGYGTPATDTGDVDGESADDLNLLTAINSGLCTLYNPTASELTAFAEFLYTGITDSIEAQLKKLLTNPLDYVLFVALAKFTPTISGRQEISFAGIGSGVSSAKISNQFIEVDCGSISYNEQFKSFLDYAPNSTVKLYLPFVSTVDLSVDDVMGSTINVNYLIDMLSGCCIARVKITRNIRSGAPNDSRVNDVLYEFQGNVYLTVPISATDWRGAYQSLVSLAGGVIGGISSGGVGGALAIASSVASSVTSQKASVGRSGQAGSSYGYMNNKKPYLILERPIQSVPSGWGSFEGYMSNTRQTIKKLKGYTEIDAGTLWTDGFDGITSDEMDMLKQITSSGFYL